MTANQMHDWLNGLDYNYRQIDEYLELMVRLGQTMRNDHEIECQSKSGVHTMNGFLESMTTLVYRMKTNLIEVQQTQERDDLVTHLDYSYRQMSSYLGSLTRTLTGMQENIQKIKRGEHMMSTMNAYNVSLTEKIQWLRTLLSEVSQYDLTKVE